MKTAVEYLIEELRNDIVGHISDVKLHVLIETALAKEKEQIIEAYHIAQLDMIDVYNESFGSAYEPNKEDKSDAKQYYNETYGKE